METTGTIRAGCGTTVVRDGMLLLVRRKRAPEAGCWGIQGGKIDWLETAPAAALRELAEETGLVARIDRLLCVVDQIDVSAQEHWLAPVYLVTDFDGEPELREPEKHAAIGWFPLAALPEPLTQATREAANSIRSLATGSNRLRGASPR